MANTKLQVILGQGYTLVSENVGIDTEIIQASGTECLFNSENLIPLVKYLFPKPIPTAVITAPNTYSFGCSWYDLAIIGENSIGNGLKYAWSASANPPVSAITTFINLQTESKFWIPVASLAATNLAITLTVTNGQLESHTAVSNVRIQSAYSLQVTVDAGTNPIISQFLVYQFKTIVSQLCGNSTSIIYK